MNPAIIIPNKHHGRHPSAAAAPSSPGGHRASDVATKLEALPDHGQRPMSPLAFDDGGGVFHDHGGGGGVFGTGTGTGAPFSIEYAHISPPPDSSAIPLPRPRDGGALSSPRGSRLAQCSTPYSRSGSRSRPSARGTPLCGRTRPHQVGGGGGGGGGSASDDSAHFLSQTRSFSELSDHIRSLSSVVSRNPGTVGLGLPDLSAVSTGLSQLESLDSPIHDADLSSNPSGYSSSSAASASSVRVRRAPPISTSSQLPTSSPTVVDDTPMNNDNRQEQLGSLPTTLQSLLFKTQAQRQPHSDHSPRGAPDGNHHDSQNHNAQLQQPGVSTRGFPSDGFEGPKSRDTPGHSRHTAFGTHSGGGCGTMLSEHTNALLAHLQSQLQQQHHQQSPVPPPTSPSEISRQLGMAAPATDIQHLFPLHHVPQVCPTPLSYSQFTPTPQSSPMFAKFPSAPSPLARSGSAGATPSSSEAINSFLAPPHSSYDDAIARMYSIMMQTHQQKQQNGSSPSPTHLARRPHPPPMSAPATPPTASPSSSPANASRIVAPTPVSGAPLPPLPVATPSGSPKSAPREAPDRVGGGRSDDYKCLYCDAKFTNESQRKRHTRTHTGEKPFPCPTCGKRFAEKANLDSHMGVHMDQKPYACKWCPKRYTQRGALTIHERTHTGERPFKCDVCNESFKSKGVLKIHMRRHSTAREFQCHICRKSFKHKSTLTTHIRTHTGDKPYPCDHCELEFADNAARIVHMRRKHSKERPYQCKHCNQCFSENSSLRRHQSVHTGARPYRCTVCNRGFATSGSRSGHYRTQAHMRRCEELKVADPGLKAQVLTGSISGGSVDDDLDTTIDLLDGVGGSASGSGTDAPGAARVSVSPKRKLSSPPLPPLDGVKMAKFEPTSSASSGSAPIFDTARSSLTRSPSLESTGLASSNASVRTTSPNGTMHAATAAALQQQHRALLAGASLHLQRPASAASVASGSMSPPMSAAMAVPPHDARSRSSSHSITRSHVHSPQIRSQCSTPQHGAGGGGAAAAVNLSFAQSFGQPPHNRHLSADYIAEQLSQVELNASRSPTNGQGGGGGVQYLQQPISHHFSHSDTSALAEALSASFGPMSTGAVGPWAT